MIFLILIVLCTIYYVLLIPESPKWLYTWGFYAESRRQLKYVAEFNGVEESRIRRIDELKFD